MPKARTKKTEELIQASHDILQTEHPMTLRQLYYRLVSKLILENCKAEYQRLSNYMTAAREEGSIIPEWIVDRSKPEIIPDVWDDVGSYIEAVSMSYHRDYWNEQPYYCEVWIEKDSLTGSIENTIKNLGVTLRAHRGYGSCTKKMEIATLFDSISKPIQIFYIGDHDPSGIDIERDLLSKITQYMETEKFISLERLAISRDDIETFNLPPLRVKAKDPRAKAFTKLHGYEVVEADALPPSELRRRIQESVSTLINVERWNHNVRIETAEFNSIREIVGKFKTGQV